MKINTVRCMTRSAVFELENDGCYKAGFSYTVSLDGQPVSEDDKNVFSLYSLLPGKSYFLSVTAGEETAELLFSTEEETFFVDAARFGLVAGGEADNTAALQAALSGCPAGGTIYVPRGIYRTGPLFLKSDTTLYLEKGAVLLGETDRSKYPILPGVLPCENESTVSRWPPVSLSKDEYYLTGWEGNPLDSMASLLNITGCTHVVITGQGTVDANAQNGDWWQHAKEKIRAYRPRTIAMNHSDNVVLHGITVQNSYSWTIHPMYTDQLDILDIRIQNDADSPNTDGIDPESCRSVRIIGAAVHVGDDCIALKSGKVFLGKKLHRPCENILIRNCLLDRGHGGLVIGSEMSGGVRKVTVTQCLMRGTDRGLRVKTRRGRGETAVIDGLTFRNVRMEDVLVPFVVNMFYCCDPDGHTDYVQSRMPQPVDAGTPRLGALCVENVHATGAQYAGCYFDGLPEQPIGSVVLRNVSIQFAPDAQAGTAAMSDCCQPTCKTAIYAENVCAIHLEGLTVEGYEGELLQLKNVKTFEEV